MLTVLHKLKLDDVAHRFCMHPYRIVIVMICCLSTCIEVLLSTTFLIGYKAPIIILSALTTMGLIITYPNIAVLFVGIISAIWSIAFAQIPLSFLILSLCCTVIASQKSLKEGIAYAAILSICALLNLRIYPDQLSTYANGVVFIYISALLLCVIWGYFLKQQATCVEQNISSQQISQLHSHTNDQMKQRNIARRLHDHTTNDLTNIIMLVDRAAKDGKPIDQSIMAQIKSLSLDALSTTRSSITALENIQNNNDQSLHRLNLLQQTIEKLRIQASYSRLNGTVLVTADSGLEEEDFILLNDFMHELVGNLVKYAEPESDYILLFDVHENKCTIESCNQVNVAHPTQNSSGLGTGLAYYRELITNRGGQFETKTQDNNWIIRIQIPLSTSENSQA